MSESPSFETALAELEQIVRALEDGSTTLEVGLAQYERGVGLLKACYAQLQAAEKRISLLTGLDSGGKPVLQAFEHSATDGRTEPRRPARPPSRDSSGLY